VYLQNTPSLPKVPEAVAAKVELPVLCQEDGKTVLRFSELFGVREPYWVIGQRKGRPKRNVAKGESSASQDYFKLMEPMIIQSRHSSIKQGFDHVLFSHLGTEMIKMPCLDIPMWTARLMNCL
jgi:hypothetical protein